jgi:hypothetical protein
MSPFQLDEWFCSFHHHPYFFKFIQMTEFHPISTGFNYSPG